jgi:drug/metabolite transporter (DMT)-like permease
LSAPLFVVVAGLAFATSAPLARAARPADPIAIAFGRVALAAVLLSAVAPRVTMRSIHRAPGSARRATGLAGVLLGAHFACFLAGLDATSLPAAIALVSLEPVSVVLVSWAVHGERPLRLEVAGIALATLGAFVVAGGAGTGEHRAAGDLLVLVAVVLYGFYVAVTRSIRESIPARPAAAVIYATAALVLLPLLYVVGPGEGRLFWPLPPRVLIAIAALAIVPTIVGHTSVQVAARRLAPSTVALVSPGETVFGLVLGAVFVRASPSVIEASGAAVIVVGATLALLARH